MTRRKLHILVLAGLVTCAALLTAAVAQGPAAPANTRLAVCDIVLVFNNYQKSKDLTAELNESRSKLQAEKKQREEAIERLRLQLEALTVGQPEYEKRLGEMQKMVLELKVWEQYEETLLMRRHHRLTEEMYEELLTALGEVAHEQGYSVVLYTNRNRIESQNSAELARAIESRKVLYNDPSLDITDAVLARLNQKYRASGH